MECVSFILVQVPRNVSRQWEHGFIYLLLEKSGIAGKIWSDLVLSKIFRKQRLIPCFEKVTECIRKELEFHPSMVENYGGNRNVTIRMDSAKAQILTYGLDAGLSIWRCWKNINKLRYNNSDDQISESCVWYALKSMRPRIVKVQKQKQGSSNLEYCWSQTRYDWTCQLLARFGELKHVHRPIQRRFKWNLIGKLDLDQVVWWDETHRK